MSMHNLELTEDLERFIEAGVASGRFSNAGEAVREGLGLLKERELAESQKLEWLRAAAKEAMLSNAAEGFDSEPLTISPGTCMKLAKKTLLK
jgi:putative addiction module CopG family antidote